MIRFPHLPAIRATAAKPRVEAVCSAPGLLYSAVRWAACPLCGAAAARPCRLAPTPGDHLYRWLDALASGRLTREQVAGEVVRLVVITKWSLIPERAA